MYNCNNSNIGEIADTWEVALRKQKAVKSKPERVSSEELIVSAYVDLSREIGVADITLQKLADKAGVAFGTVRYYFAGTGKRIHDEAFKKIISNSYLYVEAVFFELRKKKDFNPVKAYVESMFRWIHEQPDAGSFLIYIYYLSSTEVPVEIGVSETVDRARARVEGLVNEAIGMGLYRPVANAKRCASAIHALTVGYGFIAMNSKEIGLFNQQKLMCVAAVDAIVHGDESVKQ